MAEQDEIDRVEAEWQKTSPFEALMCGGCGGQFATLRDFIEHKCEVPDGDN